MREVKEVIYEKEDYEKLNDMSKEEVIICKAYKKG